MRRLLLLLLLHFRTVPLPMLQLPRTLLSRDLYERERLKNVPVLDCRDHGYSCRLLGGGPACLHACMPACRVYVLQEERKEEERKEVEEEEEEEGKKEEDERKIVLLPDYFAVLHVRPSLLCASGCILCSCLPACLPACRGCLVSLRVIGATGTTTF